MRWISLWQDIWRDLTISSLSCLSLSAPSLLLYSFLLSLSCLISVWVSPQFSLQSTSIFLSKPFQHWKCMGKTRQGHCSTLAFPLHQPHYSLAAVVHIEPVTKWSIYWFNEKISFFFLSIAEPPSFNVRDTRASARNGFSIFVVERQEKMKSAFQLAEIIYSLKGLFFISCLGAKRCASFDTICLWCSSGNGLKISL